MGKNRTAGGRRSQPRGQLAQAMGRRLAQDADQAQRLGAAGTAAPWGAAYSTFAAWFSDYERMYVGGTTDNAHGRIAHGAVDDGP